MLFSFREPVLRWTDTSHWTHLALGDVPGLAVRLAEDEVPTARGGSRERSLGQIEFPLQLPMQPCGLGVDIDDEQTVRRDADVGGRTLCPPAIDLIGIGGAIMEPMLRTGDFVAG